MYVCTHTHTHTQSYRQTLNGILFSQEKKRMSCHFQQQGWTSMLSEMIQGKTGSVCYHLCVESKKARLLKAESKLVATRG